jgi:hypothetical protein
VWELLCTGSIFFVKKCVSLFEEGNWSVKDLDVLFRNIYSDGLINRFKVFFAKEEESNPQPSTKVEPVIVSLPLLHDLELINTK